MQNELILVLGIEDFVNSKWKQLKKRMAFEGQRTEQLHFESIRKWRKLTNG